MATNYSASQTQYSDDVQEMFCEECEKHKNKYTPADGFCVDCVQYKCVDCLRYHRRHYRNHTIKDKYNMPQDFFFEKCLAHPKELIKFYCRKCDKSACQACKDSAHHNCHNVAHLPTLVKDMKPSTDTELKELKKNLYKLSNKIKDTDHELDDKRAIIDTVESKAKATIKQHKDKLFETCEQQQKEIIDKFDKELEEIIAKLRKERKDLVKKLSDNQSMVKVKISQEEKRVVKAVENTNVEFKTLNRQYLTLKYDLKKLSSDLEQAQALGQNCQLFLTMKLTKTKCEKLSQNMQKIQHNYIRYCEVQPKFESKPSIYSLEPTASYFSYKELHKSAIQRTATLHSNINFKSKDNVSLCLLNDNALLATDFGETCLEIFKISKKTSEWYHDTIKMSSQPWAITKVTDNKVAVTFPNKEMIRLFTLSESLSRVSCDDIIRVRGRCYGIAYRNNNLIVCNELLQVSTVQILDMTGGIIRTIETDSNGKSLFSRLCHLTLSPDHTTIYVSDWGRHTVTSMTFDGNVKAIYMDDQLHTPHQLTVDESGAIYVCGYLSDNVHQLSSDLTKVKILLNRSHRVNYPQSVAYCQNNTRLYVGMYNGGIKVFNLSLK